MSKMLKQAYSNVGATRHADKGPDLGKMLDEAVELHRRGDSGGASTLYGQILDIEPNHFDALHLLSMAAHQTGNPHGAIELIDMALQIRPNTSDALSNRSAILMDLGRYPEALESCLKAIQIDRKNVEAFFNAGNALVKLQRRQEAISHFQRALEIQPGFVPCLVNLGGELTEECRFEEARAVLEQAASLSTGNGMAWLNIGALHHESGNKPEAYKAYEKALQIEPGYVRALVSLSNLHFEDGRVSEAFNKAEAALMIAPGDSGANNSLGNCYRTFGEPQTAATYYRSAVAVNPNAYGFHSNLLLCMLGDQSVDSQEQLDEALRFAARYVKPVNQKVGPKSELKRIGFVSGDFRTHSVGFFLEPLLANLSGVEVYLYANQTSYDQQTEKLASLVKELKNSKSWSTSKFVEAVTRDEIDILVDLSGHTSDARLDVFAQKPAPVQVTWLGYSGTTGLTQFDALIGDAIVTPRQDEDFYSEQILRLAHGFAPFLVPADAPEVTPLPAQSNGFVTFGSFNATTKINDGVIEVWSRILRAVPGSSLLMKNLFLEDQTVRERYLGAFATFGISEERLTLLGQTTREEHWDCFAKIDIALDTFPYSGATTTADNLWMGVPVVTHLGDRYCGRMSASFLEAIGLNHLVARTHDDYVETAAMLASDLDSLAELRSGLRDRVSNSELGLGAAFAESFMSALRGLWSETEAKAA